MRWNTNAHSIREPAQCVHFYKFAKHTNAKKRTLSKVSSDSKEPKRRCRGPPLVLRFQTNRK